MRDEERLEEEMEYMSCFSDSKIFISLVLIP
jgi:hypothetical protein